MDLIQDKINLKDTKVLLDKLYTLMFIQAKEIDLIHYKLFLLEKNYKKAKEVLSISKNIEDNLKKKLYEEITAKELQEEIKETT